MKVTKALCSADKALGTYRQKLLSRSVFVWPKTLTGTYTKATVEIKGPLIWEDNIHKVDYPIAWRGSKFSISTLGAETFKKFRHLSGYRFRGD